MTALIFLRVLPLLTTSSYFPFTIAEDLYFKPYLEPSVVGAADHLLPSYVTVWYNRGMVLIFTIYPLTWGTAIANLSVAHLWETSIAAFVLYLLGLLFSIAHMLWGPHNESPKLNQEARQPRQHRDCSSMVSNESDSGGLGRRAGLGLFSGRISCMGKCTVA